MLAKILEPSTESSSFEFAQRGAEVSQFLKMQTGNTGIHFPLLSGIFSVRALIKPLTPNC